MPTRKSSGLFSEAPRETSAVSVIASRRQICQPMAPPQIDSRTVRITNKKRLQGWIDAYGLDSDFVRVRVLGEFPSQRLDGVLLCRRHR